MEYLDFNNRAAVEEYEAFLSSRSAHFLQSTLWAGVKHRWRHEADRKSVV